MFYIRKNYPTDHIIPLHTYSSEIHRQDFEITLQLCYYVKVSSIATKGFLEVFAKAQICEKFKI